MTTTCKSCNGTYTTTLANGMPYFHRCPDLSDAEVAAALALPLDASTWTKAQQATVAATPRARANARNENVPAPAQLKALVDAVPTANNPDYWKQVNAITATSIVAAGAGVTTA